jgi:hypothetical protein
MTYYRMAVHDRQTATWIWKTTTLCSLQAVLQVLRSFRALPQNSIRVFTTAFKEDLNEMLERENTHGLSGSVTAAQFLRERLLHVPGQSAVEDGAAEPVVRQTMAIAARSPWREQSAITGFPGFGDTNPLERKRMGIEDGPGSDHDIPYCFSLPVSMPQLLAWTRLQTRVQAGELEP